MTKQRGLFITLEGVDGAGKSTHTEWITQMLRDRGVHVLLTREPGGTPLGETLRDLLLTQNMGIRTETLLMFAVRAEHLRQTIEPALDAGTWVVCDRFTDASYAYQGGGRELGDDAIEVLERWVHPGLQPDRTWLFDVPLEVARARLSTARDPDRFESEGAAFFERTRAAYHRRAERDPARIHLIDSTRSIDMIRAQLHNELTELVRCTT
jgi:dTMP kinase